MNLVQLQASIYTLVLFPNSFLKLITQTDHQPVQFELEAQDSFVSTVNCNLEGKIITMVKCNLLVSNFITYAKITTPVNCSDLAKESQATLQFVEDTVGSYTKAFGIALVDSNYLAIEFWEPRKLVALVHQKCLKPASFDHQAISLMVT